MGIVNRIGVNRVEGMDVVPRLTTARAVVEFIRGQAEAARRYPLADWQIWQVVVLLEQALRFCGVGRGLTGKDGRQALRKARLLIYRYIFGRWVDGTKALEDNEIIALWNWLIDNTSPEMALRAGVTGEVEMVLREAEQCGGKQLTFSELGVDLGDVLNVQAQNGPDWVAGLSDVELQEIKRDLFGA